MSKFKVGDRVRIKVGECLIGESAATITGYIGDSCPEFRADNGVECCGHEHEMELIKQGDPMDNLKQGDVLVNEGVCDRTVQGVIGDVVIWTDGGYADLNSVSDLKERGWHLKDSTDTTELTIEDIAKKFKLKPEQVRIKDKD